MHVHHINCGTDCPLGGAMFDGRSGGVRGKLVCHCLVIETNEGLVLVDTGYGMKDVHKVAGPDHRHHDDDAQHPAARTRHRAAPAGAVGHKASDVRHIVLTHLDFDHAGGLEDFPNAAVHVMDAEFVAATGPRDGFVPRNRYRPMQFDDVHDWRRYKGARGEPWYGFDAVRQLEGLPPEILMIPLPGHTHGHAGVAVDTPNGWLLHAGDAYFYRGEVRSRQRNCTPGLRGYQTMMEIDRNKRMANQKRVRQLSVDHKDEVRVICAHDVVEFERAAAGHLL
jgi:glyoxylase-like metal-dependent hydrolase (beta-lactamase superfamily II)